MTSQENIGIENYIKHLNMMFEVSSIANQTDDVYEFLEKFRAYISSLISSDEIIFYLLEDQNFKCVSLDVKIKGREYFEYEETNTIFWDAVNTVKLTAMNNKEYANCFAKFLQNNNLTELDPSHIRVFFLDKVPICFCFIKENENNPIKDKMFDDLSDAFDYIEPIIGKLYKKIKTNEKIASLQKSLHNISILYNISQAVNFIDDLKRLLQVIIQKALVTLEAEKGSLMLYDYSINALQVRIVSGLKDKKLEESINNGSVQCAKIGIGEGIAGTVFLERKPIITNLGQADPRFVVKEILSNTKSLDRKSVV